MRQDQFERLTEYAEKLIDVLVQEMNPDNWPGHGVDPNKMDAQTRGDRFWAKKNPIATVTLAMKLNSLIDLTRRKTADPLGGAGEVDDHPDADDGLEGEVKRAEKEAAKFLEKVQKAAGATR